MGINDFMVGLAWEQLNTDTDTAKKAIKALVKPELRTKEFQQYIDKFKLTGWLTARMLRLASPDQQAEYKALTDDADKWAWVCKQATHWYL